MKMRKFYRAAKQMLKHLSRKNFSIEKYMGEVNLNLGCGNKPLKGFINVDYYNPKYADIILDLNKPLPFKDESVDLIFSDNVFEHIQNLVQLIRECHRVLKIGGFLVVKAPYFKSKHAFVDPTHVKFFTIQSMDYYVKGYFFNEHWRFFDESFSSLEIYLDVEKSLLRKLIEFYALKRPNHFENSVISNIFVFHNIIYILRK